MEGMASSVWMSPPVILSLFGLIIVFLIVAKLLVNEKPKAMILRILGTVSMLAVPVFILALAAIVGSGYYGTVGKFSAKEELVVAYQDAVTEKFDQKGMNLADSEFTPPNANEESPAQLNVEYNDLESMTHYDLNFVFDEETHEPLLLKSGNVTEELVEKLTK